MCLNLWKLWKIGPIGKHWGWSVLNCHFSHSVCREIFVNCNSLHRFGLITLVYGLIWYKPENVVNICIKKHSIHRSTWSSSQPRGGPTFAPSPAAGLTQCTTASASYHRLSGSTSQSTRSWCNPGLSTTNPKCSNTHTPACSPPTPAEYTPSP